MRLNTLILILGISLCCPHLTLALNKDAKKKILLEEWMPGIKPQVSIPEKGDTPVQKKADVHCPGLVLPDVFKKNITLRANAIVLRLALEKIGQIVGYNVIFDPEADSNSMVCVNVVDVPVWRALNTMLFPLSYGFKIEDKDLIILSKETKTFKVTLPPSEEAFSDTVSNESWTNSNGLNSANSSSTLTGSNPNMNIKVGARVFVESSQEHVSFWKDIEGNLSKMISKDGKYSFNKQAGLVMVTDNPIVLEKISRYVDLANLEANKQIQVDVKILEVTLNNESTYGIDWNAISKKIAGIQQLTLSSDFALQNITSPGFFALTAALPKDDSGTNSNGLSALVRALETQGRVEVVSEPKIMLLNNQSAMVQVGTVTSYVSNITTTTTQAGLAATGATTDQVQEGVTLRLMASILDDDILVQLTPVVTTLDQIRSINMGQGTTIEAPKTSTKSMHTLVKIKDGQTITVGGLITTNDNKIQKGIPVLRNLPFIGGLFDYKSKATTRTELLIFITPKILHR